MAPPSYEDAEYWNERFQREQYTFDWLLNPDALTRVIAKAINIEKESEQSNILHVGCGTSVLSEWLRTLVPCQSQIHNVDYSYVAIEKGRERERCHLESQDKSKKNDSFDMLPGNQSPSTAEQMQWSVLDLLSPDQVIAFKNSRAGVRTFDLIIDKSTSDAIACALDCDIKLPYSIRRRGKPMSTPNSLPQATIHPLYILAIHLAYLASPGSRWIVVSYSASRLIFLDIGLEIQTGSSLSDEILQSGLVHPRDLWQLERHDEIRKPWDATVTPGYPNVHRPPEMHHIYVLVRTSVELSVSSDRTGAI